MRQHNEKRAAAISKTESAEDKGKLNDESYEVTLDDDFLTALEYGMPPASGMVWSSVCIYFLFNLYISYIPLGKILMEITYSGTWN